MSDVILCTFVNDGNNDKKDNVRFITLSAAKILILIPYSTKKPNYIESISLLYSLITLVEQLERNPRLQRHQTCESSKSLHIIHHRIGKLVSVRSRVRLAS